MLHTILTKIKQKIINKAGCIVARWILHNCDDGLVVKRKAGGGGTNYKSFFCPGIQEYD